MGGHVHVTPPPLALDLPLACWNVVILCSSTLSLLDLCIPSSGCMLVCVQCVVCVCV